MTRLIVLGQARAGGLLAAPSTDLSPAIPGQMSRPVGGRSAGIDRVIQARLILTCGVPGAGKTVLATRLAAERAAVRLTKDEWLWALGTTPWDEPTREKIEAQL